MRTRGKELAAGRWPEAADGGLEVVGWTAPEGLLLLVLLLVVVVVQLEVGTSLC